MSLQNAVQAGLLSQANPVPPGRYVAPGSAMPVYQDNHDAQWNGAARGIANAPTPKTVTAQVNFQSNQYITSAILVNPSQTKEEQYYTQFQILCVARKAPVRDMFKTATTHHLAMRCAELYAQARRRLETRDLPEGIAITPEQFDALNEEDIREYIDNQDEIPDDAENNVLRMACRLLLIGEFKYLLPVGVISHWRLYGPINNMSVATSKNGFMDPNHNTPLVVNCVFQKRAFVFNQFGGAHDVREGGRVGFIVTRAVREDGRLGQTVIKPWAQHDAEVPAFCDRCYKDAAGRIQPGFFWPLGTIHEITSVPAPSTRCLVAAGLRGIDYEQANVAMTSLPQIMVQVGI